MSAPNDGLWREIHAGKLIGSAYRVTIDGEDVSGPERERLVAADLAQRAAQAEEAADMRAVSAARAAKRYRQQVQEEATRKAEVQQNKATVQQNRVRAFVPFTERRLALGWSIPTMDALTRLKHSVKNMELGTHEPTPGELARYEDALEFGEELECPRAMNEAIARLRFRQDEPEDECRIQECMARAENRMDALMEVADDRLRDPVRETARARRMSRMRTVLELRATGMTLAQIGTQTPATTKEGTVSVERVRQIYAKGLRILHHPSRAEVCKRYEETGTIDPTKW